MGNWFTSNKNIIESDDDIDEEIELAIWASKPGPGPFPANFHKILTRFNNECERKLTIIARETTI